MTRIIAMLMAVLPATALAQAAPQQMSPSDLAAQQMILKLTGETLQYQAQIIALQRQLEELRKQIDPKDGPKPPPIPGH